MANLDLCGSSPKFGEILEQVKMVSPVDCTVLVRGETGTGKEVIARAIHDASPRRQNRFVALNCAAIPASLLESELFGHERGAFTGAVNQRAGHFQMADRGTLFLDEIGDLPLEMQPKLLRVLQERQYERLGSSHTYKVDVRVIAATNQDLEAMVNARTFRADLYYRLNVFPITLPPLREREGDIPLLVGHFLEKLAERQGKSIERIPDHLMAELESYHWPGNIRELQNVIERAVIMASDGVLRPQIPEAGYADTPEAQPNTLADANRMHIATVLRETNWVLGGSGGAAARLGLPRTTLISKLRKLGISRETTGSGQERLDGPGNPYYSARAGRT